MVLRPGCVNLIEISQVDLFLDLPNLFLSFVLAAIEHSIHKEIHVLVQIGRVEVHLLFLALGLGLWLRTVVLVGLHQQSLRLGVSGVFACGGRRGGAFDYFRVTVEEGIGF